MDKKERIEEITRTTNQKLLAMIAQADGDSDVRQAAVEKINLLTSNQ